MDFAKLSAERYSLRKYSDRPVEAEKLALILESGRNAPTAHNNQPQRIFVLQSPEALEKADACMGSHFHPPVILAVAYDPAVSWEGILFDVGNDYLTIYQEARDRYIVSDYYSLKFIEFYDIQRRRRCAELLREEGWQSNGLSDSMGGGMNSGMTGMGRR